MKNKTLLWVLGGVTLAGLAYFFIVKGKKQNQSSAGTTGTDSVPSDSIIPEAPALATPPIVPTAPSINPLGTIYNALNNLLSNWNDYTVTTTNLPLNVRQKPDSVSKVVTTLPKGSTIKAKASGVKGWMAVSQDGQNILGYVSQQYLKLVK